MKKQNRKAFTIVELVIVIAVIGILAAVLIPTFSGIIESANRAVDTQLVAQINTTLAIEEVLGGGVNDAVEIQKIVKESGLKLQTKSKGQYIWYDIENKKAVLGGLDENGLVIETDAGTITAPFNEDTIAPENFIKGYLFLSTESADNLAENIYALRNPEGADSDAVSASLNETLGNIKNTALKSNLTAMLNTTAVMTKDGVTGFIGDNNSSVTRVIVSSEMTNISTDTINTVLAYSNVVAVDFHSGVVSADSDAITALKGRTEKPYFVYSGDELRKVDTDNGNIAFLIHKDERGQYIKTVYLENVITGEKKSIAEFLPEDEKYEFSYDLNYEYLKGKETESYDFVAYSFYEDGSNPLELGEHTHSLTSTEKLLIDGEGNLTIYLVYETVATDFKVDSDSTDIADGYYSSESVTRMLADGEITNGTITVVSTTATLGDSTHTNLTIPSGVTLHLPYYTGTGDSKVYSSNLAAKTSDSMNNTNPGNNVDKLGITGHTNLTVAEGVTLNNNGTIYVDAVLYGSSGNPDQCYIRDNCGVLVVNGTLNVGNSTTNGTLYAYGVVRGSGEIVANKGTVTEIFTVLDWHGGTNAYQCVNNNISPFHNWKIDNIRAKMTINHGAKYTAFGSIYVSEQNDIDFVLVDSSSSNNTASNPLFKTQTGASIQKTYNDGIRLDIVKGTVEDCEKSITISISLASVTADFSEVALPMPNFDISVKSGATLKLNNNLYKVLPGSDITVEKGGVLEINTTVALYDKYDLKMISKYNADYTHNNLVPLTSRDDFTSVTYGDKTLSITYAQQEYEYVGPMPWNYGWVTKSTKNVTISIPSRAMTAFEDLSPASLVNNGTLKFGANAVFTGTVSTTSTDTTGVTITTDASAKFTNTTTVEGQTVHGFKEGFAFTTASATSLNPEWQPTYADGIDKTGNLVAPGSIDATTIEAGKTYNWNGSVWN